MANLKEEAVAAGNRNNVGKNCHVFRQVAYEGRTKYRMDTDESNSLLKFAEMTHLNNKGKENKTKSQVSILLTRIMIQHNIVLLGCYWKDCLLYNDFNASGEKIGSVASSASSLTTITKSWTFTCFFRFICMS